MNTEQLKPCPFCGGPAINIAAEYITCGAGWNDECAGHQIRAVSAEAWNTRALSSTDRDEIIEEAAKVAEEVGDLAIRGRNLKDQGQRRMARRIATAVRALKQARP
jgi:hypothetical protein